MAQPPVGVITGQVSNAATKTFLEGAVVELVGANQATTTDREGRYQLNSVLGDDVTLLVSYSGLDPQRIRVPVATGQTVVRNVELTSEIYKLDRFTVAGEREGTALAETLQRQAPNVKAIVSSDTFGNAADGNIGDMLQHMAGMTADYNGHEVRQVSIRGVGADLNSVTMDGQQVASSQSANAGRAFEFEQASLGNIETIEVTKAPTPDMDGASIGGSINLVTKSAFSRSGGPVFNYSVGFVTRTTYKKDETGWKQPVSGYGPSLNFFYSDILGAGKKLGVTLNGTMHSMPGSGSTSLMGYERNAAPGPVYAFQAQRRVEGAATARVAAGMKLDYRLSEQTTISLNTSYNFNHSNVDTRVSNLSTALTIATVDANGNRTGGGTIHPSYTNGITRVYADALSSNAITVTTNDKSGRTFVITPSFRHRFDGLNIDYSLSYSSAATYYDVSHHDDKYDSRPKGQITLRLANIGWLVDRSHDTSFPTITQTQGPDMYNLNNYSALVLAQDDRRGFDTVIGGKFDLRKELRWSLPTFVKTGFNYQRQSRKFWTEQRRYSYTGPDGILGNADDNRDLGQFTDTTGYHRKDENESFRDRGGVPVWPNPYGIARHQQSRPELWKEDIAFGVQNKLQGLRLVDETVGAAYIMGNVRWGYLSALSGVRVEDTRVEGEGPLNYLSPAERARRAAWVGVVTDPEARRRAEAQFGGRTTSRGQYRVVLPGVHLKYEPVRGLVARASWSTGIGRPPFGSIIPNNTVNDDTQRVTVNNPELKPQYSNNFDLSTEYYFRSQGMVSVGVFRKKIDDYIFTDNSQVITAGADNGFEGQYAGYGLTTQANGGSAKIQGVEVSYQQQLTFLPGPWKGLGVYTNYTYLETEGNYGGTAVLTTNSLAGFLNRTGNLGLSYRGFGLDLRVQAVYRGRYLTSNSATPALVQYQKAKTSWNWKSRYAFSRKMSVFLDLENIFSEPLDSVYALYPDRMVNVRTFNMKIVAGITGRL